MGIAYSREIDGLRAVAVLSVMAYHAGLGGAGYVGVDIFFVISGYLITALLLREHEAGGIGLWAFYARRARRIVPAATAVILATCVLGMAILSAQQEIALIRSAGAALVFAANFFFQRHSGGYFDPASDEMPLLHLWSLAVEEQFYLVWPVLLILLLRYGGLRRFLLVAIVASLAAAELLPEDVAFYQTPARFWELAVGGLVATLPKRSLPAWAGWGGLVLVAVAVAYPLPSFPGVGAVPAVAGAALVILAVHSGATNPLLSSPPAVWVGLISYSLYLWHWPLLALYRATGGESMLVSLALCAVAFPIAFASYRYIEQPFRRIRWRPRLTVMASVTVGIALAAGAWGAAFGIQRAVDGEFPLAAQALRDQPSRRCHYQRMDNDFPRCEHKGDSVVWGDSMALAWSPIADTHLSRDACPPLIGSTLTEPGCELFNRRAVAVANRFSTVYLVAQWNRTTIAGLGRTLESLPSVQRIVIIGPTPTMRAPVPDCLRGEGECALTRYEFGLVAKPILEALRRAASRHTNVEVIDVTDQFCTAAECPPVLRGIPLYWDTHHVTSSAVRAIRLQ